MIEIHSATRGGTCRAGLDERAQHAQIQTVSQRAIVVVVHRPFVQEAIYRGPQAGVVPIEAKSTQCDEMVGGGGAGEVLRDVGKQTVRPQVRKDVQHIGALRNHRLRRARLLRGATFPRQLRKRAIEDYRNLLLEESWESGDPRVT